MNEAAPITESHEYKNTPEESFKEVIDRARVLLNSLEETLDEYSEITVHGKTVEAKTECDKCVARATRLNEGLAGLREKQGEANDYHAEQAAAMLSEGAQLLEGWLKLRADVDQEVDRNPEAKKLKELLDDIALKLMPAEAVNDETNTAEKEAA